MGQAYDAGAPPLLADDFFIINSTGPGLVSRTLAENKEIAKSVTVLFPRMCATCVTAGIALVTWVYIWRIAPGRVSEISCVECSLVTVGVAFNIKMCSGRVNWGNRGTIHVHKHASQTGDHCLVGTPQNMFRSASCKHIWQENWPRDTRVARLR